MNHITLVTWSGTGNFGTSLQAYALERVLEKLGFRVSLVSEMSIQYGWRAYARWVRHLLGIDRVRMMRRSSYRQRKFYVWKEQHLHELTMFNAFQLKLLRWITSVYVTGSDQIWNTYVEFSPTRFLDFAGEGVRVAYASSIGTDSVNPKYAAEVKSLLLRFKHIGVRENAAVRALSQLTGRTDITKVLDPTFLLGRKEWLKLAGDAKLERALPKHYIFCYLIGNNKEYAFQLKDVQRKVGMQDVILVPSLESPDAQYDGVDVYSFATPSEFVNLIANADFVCTDSFHATVLSIVFKKDFVEFLRFPRNDVHSQNSRLDELLNDYGLLDRYYDEWQSGDNGRVDYSPVESILIKDKQRSLNFLRNSIAKGS